LGARDIPSAKRHIKKLVGWMYIVMFVYNVGILLAMPLIFRLFSLTPDALAYGRLFGTIFCTADILFWIPSYGIPNALRSAGDAAFTMWVGVFSMWLIRVGGAYLLAYVFGVGPVCVWIGMCCEWIVRGIFFTTRLVKGKWQKKRVI
jgi:Na+-driven multidrug efflux pump